MIIRFYVDDWSHIVEEEDLPSQIYWKYVSNSGTISNDEVWQSPSYAVPLLF